MGLSQDGSVVSAPEHPRADDDADRGRSRVRSCCAPVEYHRLPKKEPPTEAGGASVAALGVFSPNISPAEALRRAIEKGQPRSHRQLALLPPRGDY